MQSKKEKNRKKGSQVAKFKERRSIMANSITMEEITTGPASDFRQNINTNFENVANEFDEVYNTMVDVVVSEEQPQNQKTGDLWFKTV